MQESFMSKAGVLAVLIGLWGGAAWADTNWKEGEQYFRVEPVQPSSVAPGKIEVVEVFSYACPACNLFYPTINKLKASLPAKVQWRFVPASWHVEEDWKVFQRAYFAAEALGIAERTHSKIFDAVWKTRELAIVDTATNQIKNPLPSLADVAKYYESIEKLKPGEFLDTAHSFSVDAKMREADAQIRLYQVDETPSVIVNGKYRLTPRTAGGTDQFIALVQWLVKQESK
jgi:protein dithiol oxidoreductase (disulfide-forming)